jgi:hypothetical protein
MSSCTYLDDEDELDDEEDEELDDDELHVNNMSACGLQNIASNGRPPIVLDSKAMSWVYMKTLVL